MSAPSSSHPPTDGVSPPVTVEIVTDVGSSNGTFVDGVRVAGAGRGTVVVPPSGAIRLGRVTSVGAAVSSAPTTVVPPGAAVFASPRTDRVPTAVAPRRTEPTRAEPERERPSADLGDRS